MMPAITTSVHYELEQIRKGGLYHKLFILTRPPRHSLLKRLGGAVRDFASYKPKVEWVTFQEQLRQAGFKSNINPGRGAVIGMTADMETVILREGCRKPSEYAMTIKQGLAGRQT